MSVKRCMREVSSKEYCYWRAHAEQSPIGGFRGDIQAAVIAQQIDTLVQLKCDGRATGKPLTAFMPLEKKTKQEQTAEQQLAMFQMVTGSSPK